MSQTVQAGGSRNDQASVGKLKEIAPTPPPKK